MQAHNTTFYTSKNQNEINQGKLWRITSPSQEVSFIAATVNSSSSNLSYISPELKLAINLSQCVIHQSNTNMQENLEKIAEILLHIIDYQKQPHIAMHELQDIYRASYNFAYTILKYLCNDQQFNTKLTSILQSHTHLGNMYNENLADLMIADDLLLPQYFDELSIYPIMFIAFISEFDFTTKYNSQHLCTTRVNLESKIVEHAIKYNKTVTSLDSMYDLFSDYLSLHVNRQFSMFNSIVTTTYVDKAVISIINMYQKIISEYSYVNNAMTTKTASMFTTNMDSVLYHERTNKFIKGITRKLETTTAKSTFVALEAKHIYGKYGLIHNLMAKGYSIERIYETPDVFTIYDKVWQTTAAANLILLARKRKSLFFHCLALTLNSAAVSLSLNTINCNKPKDQSFTWAFNRAMLNSRNNLHEAINNVGIKMRYSFGI